MFILVPHASGERHLRKFEISWAIFRASCVLTCPAESKPNSKISKMKMIGVMLMASSIIDKKSPRRGRRAEHQSTDLRGRTRRKHASRTLERLDLSSRYFLNVLKVEISENLRFLARVPSALRLLLSL